jgi:YnbE-like lipoprotein
MKERSMPITRTLAAGALLAAAAGTSACSPTIKLATPDKPIEINLNVKIDQEVRIRLDKDLEDLIAKNPDLF